MQVSNPATTSLKGEGMTDWKQFLTKQIFKESSFTNTVTISCDGGEEMICPNCGFTANYVVNGDKFCANCLSLLMPYPKTSISDLEKIEPLNPRNVSSEYWNATHENRAKLNEVIEKVNRIMEVMNRR